MVTLEHDLYFRSLLFRRHTNVLLVWWELAADTLDYQCGRPGRRAVYTIETVADGLRFTLDADDADDKPIHHVYGGKLDGGDVLHAQYGSNSVTRKAG